MKRNIDSKIFYCAIGLLVLNIFDAFATLRHMQYGVEEANPVMDFLIQHGIIYFIMIKHLLVGICVVMLCAGNAKKSIYILTGLFGVLGVWHMVLFYLI